MHEPVQWTEDGHPRSPRFNDRYRSQSDGLAQAWRVFAQGCGLPQAWQRREVFTVLETGFGLGLNFLCTWAQWEADANRCERLRFVSIEAHPVSVDDIRRSVKSLQASDAQQQALLDQISALADELAQVWPDLRPGVQSWTFSGGQVELVIALGDVQAMLPLLREQADAIYLDGFSPALNPDMWSAKTLKAVSVCARPGARVASYTVSLAVREALQSLGFEVRKCPGLPPKRHRLEAVFRPSGSDRPHRPPACE